jgi:hypothetical protein
VELKPSEQPKSEDDLDILWGAQEIAAFIRRTEREVYYLHEAGHFGDAVRKVGASIVGSRKALRKHLLGGDDK